MEFDSQKILHYNQLFSRWKNELFPRREYAYENECCYAFAHKLAVKAKENGFTPLKAWCLESSSRTILKIPRSILFVSRKANRRSA